MRTLKVEFRTRQLGQHEVKTHIELIDVEVDSDEKEIDMIIREEYNRLYVFGKDVESYPYRILDL